MNTFDLIKTLTETPGPSGFEGDIAAIIHEIWEPLVDELHQDRVGSLVGIKYGRGNLPEGGKRPRILIAAHMDELGLMVTNILDNNGHGFLRVVNLGGVDVRQLANQRVMVHGRRNIPGLLGALPASMLPADKQDNAYDYETLVVDTGLPFAELSKQVSIGDAISFHQPLRQLNGSNITGKALDNRVSVAAVTIALENLQHQPHLWDVIVLASCQEETRLLGAATTAYRYHPELAIAVDVTFGQGPSTSDPNSFILGDGPTISHAPDVHPGVVAGLKKAAESLEMKTQNEYAARGGGTDAYYMQIAHSGIPTGIVGIPLRYMHTMVESIHTKDVERSGRLLAQYISQLNGDTIGKLQEELMS